MCICIGVCVCIGMCVCVTRVYVCKAAGSGVCVSVRRCMYVCVCVCVNLLCCGKVAFCLCNRTHAITSHRDGGV